MSAAVVYRMYDADLHLLYVGCSTNLMQRVSGHRSTVPWWPDVDTITVEHFADRSSALAAETVAIRDERPLHNVRGLATQSATAKPQPAALYLNQSIYEALGGRGTPTSPMTRPELEAIAAELGCRPEALSPCLSGFTKRAA